MNDGRAGVTVTFKPLRRLAVIRSSNVDKLTEEGEETVRLCNYVDVYYNGRITGSLDLSYGSATPQEIKKFSLRAGDVLITKDSETPDDIAVAALVEPSAEGVVCGYHLAILRPIQSEVFGPYLFWALSAKPVREAFSNKAQGITRFGLTLSGISSVPVPVQDMERQRTIAFYLDRETARIDELIAKKGRQVDLLDQHARQTITEIVSGRAGHNGQHVTTGLSHLPTLPAHWLLRRAGLLFRQVAEPNINDLPVLSVSIHHGISDRQLNDEERDRKVNLIEDRTSYKRVRPGYLAYNMMRAWQGAVGVSTVNGAVSPAYVVAKPTRDLHSPYYQFLLRTPPFIEQMRQGSKGITDFRLRLYWEQFRQILLPVPSLQEQREIAWQAEAILNKAAKTTAAIRASVQKLRERRAALITAAVTGQIDVRHRAVEITTKPDRNKFRLIVGAEIVHRHRDTRRFGRIKNQKLLYLAEAHVGISELGGNYIRFAADPYDDALIKKTEWALEAAAYYSAQPANGDSRGVTYVPLAKAGQHGADLKTFLGGRTDALRSLIDLLHDFDTEAVEAITTLYAVWNDALMDGETPDDAALIRGVLREWHPDKMKFTEDALAHWLAWMRRNGLVPRGQGPRTAHTMTRDLFP